MKRLFLVLLFGLLAASLVFINFAQAQYTPRGEVRIAPSTPLLTAVDPYANPDRANSLNPTRPYWYAADASGLKIMKLADNTVLGTVNWPATISLAQPNGTMATVAAPPAGWEPVRLAVPFPDGEGIGPEALEGATTVAFVVMAHSGFEWRTSDGRFRDTIAPMTSADTESSMMVMVDVSDPATPVVFAGALLGHDAGQMTWDPNAGAMYVANMPSKSLPANLESFVSKITPPETGAEPPAPFTPKTFYPLCGKEIEWSGEVKVAEKVGVPVGAPEVWACDAIRGAGEGEGPFEYEFTGLPTWLVAHLDSVTGKPDGVLYGTPTEVGIYTFVAKVTDHGGDPSLPAPTASAVVTVEVKLSVMEFAAGEMEVEAGTVTSMPVWATATSTCETTPGETEVPPWFQILTVPNGCIFIMNSPTLSGEYYNFVMPNLTRIDPRTGLAYPGPWVVAAEVLGTYGFDSLPPGVGLSGIAWHEVDMIPGEPDKYNLNGEFFGVDAITGQLYKFSPPYEMSDTIEEVGPPSLEIETNEVSAEGLPLLDYLKTTRPDVADAVAADPNLKVFGDLVVEADGDIFVGVPLANSASLGGAVIKVSGGTPNTTINLPGVQATYLALDSDLEPAVKPDLGGIGQIDHGVLWATGSGSGNVAVINTAAGTLSQTLPVAGASSLGSVATDSVSVGLTYVAGQALQNVTIFGAGITYETVPQIAAIGTTLALVDPPTTMTVGEPDEFTVVAAAWPVPQMSATGTLPPGMVAVDNGNGTLTVSGTPTTAGTYPFTAVATNTQGTARMEFTFAINALAPPAITSANTATLPVGIASQFKFEATGMPNPIFTFSGALPDGVTFHDNAACAPLVPGVACTGSAFLGGLPTSTGTYPLTVTATNSQGSVTQEFTLIIGENASPATAPSITSASSTTFSLGFPTAFTVTASGNPKPNLTYSGTLPSGVTFTDNYNGTATLTGTTNAGDYPLTITAVNGVSPAASQNFTLRVVEPMATAPTITSDQRTAFTVGRAGSFKVTTTGWPLPALSHTGTLPGGVNFTDNHDGTATLAGSPDSEGTFKFRITAANGVLGNIFQDFTLTTQFGQVKKLTNVGPAPESIAVDEGKGLIYVGSFQREPFAPAIYTVALDRFLNIPTASVTGSLLPNLGRVYSPYDAELAVNPSNHLLYQSQGSLHQVLVFDPLKGTQLGKIDFGGWEPTGIAIDEKRNIIYIGAKAPLVEADEGGNVSKCKIEPGDNAPSDEECRRIGAIWVFDGGSQIPKFITKIPAGDDPESVVFNPTADKVYAANEDDGTVTIATAVALLKTRGGSTRFLGGRVLSTLKVFSHSVCAGWDRAEEADKMAVDPVNNYVYLTDDKYRVAKISGRLNKVAGILPIGTRGKDFQCPTDLPLLGSTESGANSANNIAISSDRRGNVRIYVTSEQDFITMIDPKTFQIVSTLKIPEAIHLDSIAVIPESNAVLVTDEWAQMFEIRGQCAKGVASACTLIP